MEVRRRVLVEVDMDLKTTYAGNKLFDIVKRAICPNSVTTRK